MNDAQFKQMQQAMKPRAKKNQKNKKNGVPKLKQPSNRAQKPKPRSGSFSTFQQSNSAPVAYARPFQGREPRISASRNKCRVIHRELIANVTGSSAFTVSNTVNLNPGLAASFPWLSNQAIGWETYRFHALRFCYLARCGTDTPGSTLLTVDYDPNDGAALTEQFAASYVDSREDAVWKDNYLTCRPAAMFSVGPQKFVRNVSSNIAGSDIRLYDAGTFFVCTTDGTAVNWGKLYVEYDVEFFTPQTPPTGLSAVAYLFNTQATATTANPFGTTASTTTGTLGVVITQPASTGVLTFANAGVFDITWTIDTTGTSTPANPTTSGTFSTFETVGYEITGSGTTKSSVHVWGVQVPAGGTVTFSGAMSGTAVSRITISLMPFGVAAN